MLNQYLKVKPKNLAVYQQALIHSSYKEADSEGDAKMYERLEFLGDALLGAFVSNWLYHKFPDKNEGELSRLRSKLISRKYLNKLAFNLRINHLIYFSTRESLSENSIPGNTLEALFGAIYLDLGQKALSDTLDFVFQQHVNVESVERQEADYKSLVVQYSQKHKLKMSFKVVQREHKNGRDFFTVDLFVQGVESSRGQGFSKKKAEQKASKLMAQKLKLS
ncbi:MAG: ribonuclease III [Luteibaculum sp.]